MKGSKKVYFIGDTHFGHGNILKLSQRPFETLEEMETHVMNEWNRRVNNEDTVYILGDFWYKGSDSPVNYIRKLKGKKVLIRGNHDIKALKNREFVKEFEEIVDMKEIIIDNTQVVMCHYPMLEWNGYFRGGYMIHGHIHNNRPKYAEYLLSEERLLNAGVDVIGFKPVTFEELKELNKTFKEKEGFKGSKQSRMGE